MRGHHGGSARGRARLKICYLVVSPGDAWVNLTQKPRWLGPTVRLAHPMSVREGGFYLILFLLLGLLYVPASEREDGLYAYACMHACLCVCVGPNMHRRSSPCESEQQIKKKKKGMDWEEGPWVCASEEGARARA